MASVFDAALDWLGLQRKPVEAQEAQSPTPKEELPYVEPIGYGNELNPMDKKDRKDPASVVQAAIQAAQNRTRAARYADFAAMDASDIAAMLDALVDAVLTFEDVSTGRGFKVESDDKGIDELLIRERLVQKAPGALFERGNGGDFVADCRDKQNADQRIALHQRRRRARKRMVVPPGRRAGRGRSGSGGRRVGAAGV